MRATDRFQRGLALIVVLWTVVLVSLLASQLVGRTTQDLRLARNLAERSVLEVAADGGVRYAIAALAGGHDAPLAAQGGIRITIGDVLVAVQADLEAERVDLNAAPPELLRALLLALGVAEADARQAAELIAESRARRRFRLPLELTQVADLPPEIWRPMLPYVTTFTGESLPLATTGLAPVRGALALLDGSGDVPSTSGPLWITSAYNAGQSSAATPGPERIVRITAEATGPTEARFVRVAVVVIRPGSEPPHTVLSWQNGRAAFR